MAGKHQTGKHIKQAEPKRREPAAGAERKSPEKIRKPRKRLSGKAAVLLGLVCALAVLLLAFGAFVFYTANLETVYPNVQLEGVDVGRMSRTAALLTMESEAPEGYEGKSVTVQLPMENQLTVTAQQLALEGTREKAVETALGYGRDGNALQNAFCYLRCLHGEGVNILWEGSGMDTAALQSAAEEAAEQVNEELSAAGIEIGDENIRLVKGAGAAYADPEEIAALVENAFALRDYSDIEYEPELQDYSVDVQALYDQIYQEAKNAEYDKETDSVTDHVTGVSFDVAQAERNIAGAKVGQRVTIELVFTEPEITSDTLHESLFRDCLAEKSTSLSGSGSSRINNIELAAAAINDTVLLPGEGFSYNGCLGERTTDKGYQSAGAYANGKHTTAVGGGICQASSTLYYCTIKANLEITERWDHYFAVSYLPMGMDATVSWEGPDFCFVNSRDYPIKIKAWVADGELYVQLWGTDTDGSYVDISSEGWEDASYYYAQTYRNVYAADGTLISSEPEAYSRYHKYEAESEDD